MKPRGRDLVTFPPTRVRIYSLASDRIVMAEGDVVGYCEHPTVIVREDDGTQRSWLADAPFDIITPEEPEEPVRIVVLCGSTRFADAYREATIRETIAGAIVLSIGCNLRTDHELWTDLDPSATAALKARLDELHLRKIDLADEVLVLNVNGYIGESTRREIDYATKMGKPIRYLEEPEEPTPDFGKIRQELLDLAAPQVYPTSESALYRRFVQTLRIAEQLFEYTQRTSQGPSQPTNVCAYIWERPGADDIRIDPNEIKTVTATADTILILGAPKLRTHGFESDPRTWVRACQRCGRWSDHHIHTGDKQSCTCSECRRT